MILVTGATGLVGGHLIWFLLQENDRVVAIRRTSSNIDQLRIIFSFYTHTPEIYLSRIDWRIADVRNINSIRVAMHDISIVYHCAAVVTLGQKDVNMSDTNIYGTRNMVAAAIENNIVKFCFVSSIATFGRAINNEQIDESYLWSDTVHHSLYSQSKYDSEQEVWKGIKAGLNAVIVNPGVILGVSGSNSGSSQLFSEVQNGLMFYTLGGSGFVDVQDVVKSMILMMKSTITCERFIIVGENCSNKDILNWMADGLGKHRPLICIGKTVLLIVAFLLEIIGSVFHFHPRIDRETAFTISNREYYSNRKIKECFGITFNPIRQSIAEITQFYTNNKK